MFFFLHHIPTKIVWLLCTFTFFSKTSFIEYWIWWCTFVRQWEKIHWLKLLLIVWKSDDHSKEYVADDGCIIPALVPFNWPIRLNCDWLYIILLFLFELFICLVIPLCFTPVFQCFCWCYFLYLVTWFYMWYSIDLWYQGSQCWTLYFIHKKYYLNFCN